MTTDIKEVTVREIHAEQFAKDWLLVAMNDYNSYQQLMEMRSGKVAEISDSLKEDWERLVSQVVELVEEHVSDTASLFISQILGGQGSLPFDIIAKEIKEQE
jgi:hypothetical protein